MENVILLLNIRLHLILMLQFLSLYNNRIYKKRQLVTKSQLEILSLRFLTLVKMGF